MRVLLWVLVAVPLAAQWDDVPSNLRRLPDGTVDLTAPAPKAADGKPDLSGLWHYISPTEEGDLNSGADPAKIPFLNIAAPLPPDGLPMKPEAAALFGARAAGLGKDTPLGHCLPPGIPWNYLIPDPFKIVQMRDLVIVLHEEGNNFRQIFLDGRKLPKDPVPTWNGYSIGRWDGDTLVVDSSGFNASAWLDGMGHPRTEQLHLTERFHRLDAGHLDIQITVDDPGAYQKPWSSTVHFDLLPDWELMEKICLENEKDVEHLVGK